MKKNLPTSNFQLPTDKRGVAALLIVVIVGAATLIMAYSASILGLGELDVGYVSQKGGEAFSVADACTEETLRRIFLDNNYGVGAGNINLSVDNGSCIINVVDLGSNQRRITTTGTVTVENDTYNKSIQTEITISSGVIAVDSWEEI